MEKSNEVPQEIPEEIRNRIYDDINNLKLVDYNYKQLIIGAEIACRHLAAEIASLKSSAEVLKMIRPEEPTLKDMAD